MTFLTVLAAAGFVIATLVAPRVDAWLRDRRRFRVELDRCGRCDLTPRVPPPPPIRRDHDPSPRPRYTDAQLRDLAEWEAQR